MRLIYVIPALGFCLALLASAFSADADHRQAKPADCPAALSAPAEICAPGKQADTRQAGLTDRPLDDTLLASKPLR